MPTYRVLTKSFIGDKLVEAGERVEYEGEIGSNLEAIAPPAPAVDPAALEAAKSRAIDRDALKAEAADLGLDFPSNIPTDKLAAMVAEAKGASA